VGTTRGGGKKRVHPHLTAFVDSVVDRVINPVVHPLDLVLLDFREQTFISLMSLPKVLRDESIKIRIQHTNGLGGLVVYDSLLLLVP
jgi:hypothetical protein